MDIGKHILNQNIYALTYWKSFSFVEAAKHKALNNDQIQDTANEPKTKSDVHQGTKDTHISTLM